MAGVSVMLSMTAFANDHDGNDNDGVPKHGWHHAHHKDQNDGQYNTPPYHNWNRNNQYYWNNHNYRWYQNGWIIINNGPNGYQAPPVYYNNGAAANGIGNFLNSLFH